MITVHTDEVSKEMNSTIKTLSTVHRAFGRTLLGMGLKRKAKFTKPKRKLRKKLDVSITERNGLKVVSFSHLEFKPRKRYVYLHGGAYVLNDSNMQYNFINKIVLNAKAEVFYIDYPLAPFSTAKDTVSKTLTVVESLLEEYPDIEIIGDSAGAGLALVIKEELIKKNKQIKHLYLMSPWVDLSMTNDCYKSPVDDFMFNKEQLLQCAKMYAGELDLKDPLCSPMYGSVSNDVTIYAGMDDLLYPDIEEYVKQRPNITLHSYTGLTHVFPLFVGTNEAEIVIRDIIK